MVGGRRGVAVNGGGGESVISIDHIIRPLWYHHCIISSWSKRRRYSALCPNREETTNNYHFTITNCLPVDGLHFSRLVSPYNPTTYHTASAVCLRKTGISESSLQYSAGDTANESQAARSAQPMTAELPTQPDRSRDSRIYGGSSPTIVDGGSESSSRLVAAASCAVNYNGVSIKPVTDKVMEVGEGPFWDSENNVLYFVDIDKHRVYRFFQNRLEHVQLAGSVGFVIPVAGRQGLFVVGAGTTLTSLRWKLDEKSSNATIAGLTVVDGDKPGNRWNDAKADINGHLWAGTMGFEDATGNIPRDRGTLYRLDDTACFKRLDPVVPKVGISNGLAWNDNGTRMYYIDSLTRKISLFDYEPSAASISNRRTFYDFNTDNLTGVPDGMTIDADGDLWVANYNGGQVLHVSGDSGKLLGKLKIAAEKVSSVTFGGPGLDKLYVTTISRGVARNKFKEFPMTGKVLEVSGLGVRGRPNRRVRDKCF